MFFRYIITNKRNGTIYVGSTTDLKRRMQEHKNGTFVGFTAKYKLDQLVYFEQHAIWAMLESREERIKHWKRLWKIKMIEVENLEWKDLSNELS